MPVAYAVLTNNGCGHMEPILDAEMPEQARWPARVVCSGLAWTVTFSWKSEGSVASGPGDSLLLSSKSTRMVPDPHTVSAPRQRRHLAAFWPHRQPHQTSRPPR